MLEILSGNAVIIACLILGAGLIVVEALTPGMGLPGLMGTLLLGLGTFLMWRQHGSNAGLVTLLIALVFTFAAVLFSLKSAASGRLSKSKIILNGSSEVQPLDAEQTLVGMEGVALTPLSPVGDALLDDRKLDVLTQGEYIAKGEKIRVIRTEGKKIIVTRA
ncbi:MAG: hypothetical protein II912_09915 [Clostridia bacterium]|nr:hypothetical protein [Clostridia bacterium]